MEARDDVASAESHQQDVGHVSDDAEHQSDNQYVERQHTFAALIRPGPEREKRPGYHTQQQAYGRGPKQIAAQHPRIQALQRLAGLVASSFAAALLARADMLFAVCFASVSSLAYFWMSS